MSAYDYFNNGTNRIDSQIISAIKSGSTPLLGPASTLSLNTTTQIYPLGGLPYKSTYLTDEGYGLITYKSDRFGFRNNDKTWNNALAKKNIFLIGDSFVQGYSVPDDATIHHVREILSSGTHVSSSQKTKRVEVIFGRKSGKKLKLSLLPLRQKS